jgi:phosphoglycerol transferase MdoB-like AlkP superfamily enzyme
MNKDTPEAAEPSTLRSRGSILRLLILIYFVISAIDRVVLFVWSPPAEGASLLDLPLIFLVGMAFDLIAICWLLLPGTLYSLLMPRRVLQSAAQKVVTRIFFFVVLGVLLFNVTAGWVFWEEFSARYNFIAVDYLVYTTEVIDNIQESYSMPLLLSGLLVATSLLFWSLRNRLRLRVEESGGSRRALLPLLIIPALAWFFLDASWARVSVDRYRNEITKDGVYSLFASFRDNVLDFEQNFASLNEDVAFQELRGILSEDQLEFVSDDIRDLRRHRASINGEKRNNVVVIIVESLSAAFMNRFADDGVEMTPRLDALADESLLFSNLFATGSRTVRGLEALTLSLPPTPGRSIVKRLENENLDNIGWQFKDRGYDSQFFYGGYGYFDNMNHFFSSNGFEVIDRANLQEDEVRFANAWGVCDQDMFDRTLKEADASVDAGNPFFSVVLTTSNHRPYTYPDVVPLPPGSGRAGAVQYTDFAIGEFLDSAKDHAWFDNTIFVVVGDHCASSAGKRDITVSKHHIPMLFYAPSLIEAKDVPRVASQIDFAPTLLGLLDFDYTSSFLGHDLMAAGPDRAYIGNYQTLGLYEGDELCLLGVKSSVQDFGVDRDLELIDAEPNPGLIKLTIACYQSAAAAYISGGFQLDRESEASRR